MGVKPTVLITGAPTVLITGAPTVLITGAPTGIGAVHGDQGHVQPSLADQPTRNDHPTDPRGNRTATARRPVNTRVVTTAGDAA
jgi:hypothetical protein